LYYASLLHSGDIFFNFVVVSTVAQICRQT
jgi:hypothetical protein